MHILKTNDIGQAKNVSPGFQYFSYLFHNFYFHY